MVPGNNPNGALELARRRSARNLAAVLLVGYAAILSGCTVGPNYKRPTAPVAAKWDLSEPWRESAPKDAVPKGDWWTVFGDEDLNGLEKDALADNQTLKVSIAHLEQARATAAIQVATLFPTATANPSIERQRLSGERPSNGVPAAIFPVTQNT